MNIEPTVSHDIVMRLKRARGQLDGVINMIDYKVRNSSCRGYKSLNSGCNPGIKVGNRCFEFCIRGCYAIRCKV